MATVVLKLFAGQGTATDGQTKRRLYASLFGEHKDICLSSVKSCFAGSHLCWLLTLHFFEVNSIKTKDQISHVALACKNLCK